jgi:hypothetical protein
MPWREANVGEIRRLHAALRTGFDQPIAAQLAITASWDLYKPRVPSHIMRSRSVAHQMKLGNWARAGHALGTRCVL